MMRWLRQHRRWIAGGVILAGLLVMSTPYPTRVLAWPLTLREAPRPSDVIIVLGAGSRRGDDALPTQAKSRIRKGLELQRQGYAPTVIVAGGYSPRTGKTEAPLMRAFAAAQGADPATILEEPQSRNTFENATNTLAIMEQQQWSSALVVTSPYHTWRACHIYRKLNADVRCIAAPFELEPVNSVYERLVNFRSVVREYGAILYFFARRYV